MNFGHFQQRLPEAVTGTACKGVRSADVADLRRVMRTRIASVLLPVTASQEELDHLLPAEAGSKRAKTIQDIDLIAQRTLSDSTPDPPLRSTIAYGIGADRLQSRSTRILPNKVSALRDGM